MRTLKEQFDRPGALEIGPTHKADYSALQVGDEQKHLRQVAEARCDALILVQLPTKFSRQLNALGEGFHNEDQARHDYAMRVSAHLSPDAIDLIHALSTSCHLLEGTKPRKRD